MMTAPWRRVPAPVRESPLPIPQEPAQTPDERKDDRKSRTKESNERYRAKNTDKVREWQRTQYLRNREERIAAAKANGQARAARDPGAAIAKRVLSRESDIHAARQREKEYRERNADRVRELAKARARRYREIHADELRAGQREAARAKHAANRDEINAKRRALYAVRKTVSSRLSMAESNA